MRGLRCWRFAPWLIVGTTLATLSRTRPCPPTGSERGCPLALQSARFRGCVLSAAAGQFEIHSRTRWGLCFVRAKGAADIASGASARGQPKNRRRYPRFEFKQSGPMPRPRVRHSGTVSGRSHPRPTSRHRVDDAADGLDPSRAPVERHATRAKLGITARELAHGPHLPLRIRTRCENTHTRRTILGAWIGNGHRGFAGAGR